MMDSARSVLEISMVHIALTDSGVAVSLGIWSVVNPWSYSGTAPCIGLETDIYSSSQHWQRKPTDFDRPGVLCVGVLLSGLVIAALI